MGIEKENYGVTKEGKQVTKYTLTNGQGASVSFLDYGAVIQSIIVPDKDGKLEDVVLGYDTLSGYESNVPSFGSPVGRCANRISNACFVLNGKEYPLDNNDATNCLHGGFLRYNYLMYDAECATSQDDASVSFSRVSPDGEQGFPGNLTLTITYTWNDANELMIEYNAVSDADTILNITNHSYFNLAGHDAGSICDEKMMIDADAFTELGQGSICTGKVIPVEGTPMDFRTARRVGDHIDDAWPQLTLAGGYDHNWVLNTEFGKVQKFAQVEDEKAGRTMEVYTDLPGVQFYAGNFIDPQTGKDGASYGKRCALCLETQYFPNSINIPSFLQPVVEAGEAYHSVTIYKFV